MEDQEIIEMFFSRSEAGIDALSKKYGTVLYRISRNVLKNHEDAEECVNDTYLAVWNAIPPSHPQSLYAFVCRIVRNLSLNRYRYYTAEKRKSEVLLSLEELADSIGDGERWEDRWIHEERVKRLEVWLDTLTEENLYIFMRRYWYMEEISTIAKALHLSENAVYLRLDRMKKNLWEYLKDENKGEGRV